MRGMVATVVSLGLAVCLWPVGGCTAGRDRARGETIPRPFVLALEDPCDYHLLLTGAPQTYGMRSGRVRLAPGRSVGRHSTKGNEEILVFFSGRGEARIGEDARLQVGAGHVAYIPPRSTHDIVNTGTEPLIYVFCVAPAGGRR